MTELQGEIKKIQEQNKENREGQGKALMELYAKNKVNPFSGCLVILVQLPILIAMFQVFQGGFDPKELAYLYSFVPNPGALNPQSFGLLDLSIGNLYLGFVAAITQYYQTKLTLAYTSPQPISLSKGKDFAQILQWQSLYFFPVIIFAWSYKLPAALTLYWTVLNIFAILQEIITRKFSKKSNGVKVK